MKYKGRFEEINPRPKTGEWIEIFVSDWNKDFWAFYAYIRADYYKDDINAILKLIDNLNWRDGDVYVELINHSDGFKQFYHALYENDYFNDWSTLTVENWEIVQRQ